ncbi:10297_t:CDS:2 [Diversispora eburnea]|uniref:Superoxide dismutase [Cu-Zn] n=1 Tax=Diversispora eburnea TaxID=1213867 RepID=A0A9N8VB88_9GLOM|nr:10297_t:CDS:2 [Diversispora eburnea]
MNFFKIQYHLHLFFVLSLFILCFVPNSHQSKVKFGAVAVLMNNKPDQPQINGIVNFTQLNLHKTPGGHYNPFNLTHGAPYDIIRHIGDLGNVKASQNGTVQTTIYDKFVKLTGPFSVIGRTIVIHAGQDDLGRGNNATSLTNGNSGARVACGVIGWRNITQA